MPSNLVYEILKEKKRKKNKKQKQKSNRHIGLSNDNEGVRLKHENTGAV
jgi:hypothetical protein